MQNAGSSAPLLLPAGLRVFVWRHWCLSEEQNKLHVSQEKSGDGLRAFFYLCLVFKNLFIHDECVPTIPRPCSGCEGQSSRQTANTVCSGACISVAGIDGTGPGDRGEENPWEVRPVTGPAVREPDPEVAWNLTDLPPGPRLHLMLGEMPGGGDAGRSWSPQTRRP